jgi:hypothetical protein
MNDATATSSIAESYVRLVLALGAHDRDFVDAYYGPPDWRGEAERSPTSLDAILERAGELRASLGALPSPEYELERLRLSYLMRQLEALAARSRMLLGERLDFDRESLALYDAVAPVVPESEFVGVLRELEELLPGAGPVQERYERLKQECTIAPERVDQVFRAATEEARRRSAQWILLPEEESFTLEYVTQKSWSGYNWYRGSCASLIQINTDLPITIDRAVDLASHEGYPGHHVYNCLLEDRLVRKRGWVEFCVYALFSPQSLIAEGTANFGIAMAFPGPERVAFEQEVLFPLAGIEPQLAEPYYRVHELVQKLSYAGNEAARGYLNGTMSAEEAVDWLMRYALMSRARAQQRIRFFDQYRSYVINYNLGQDMVRLYVEGKGGTADNATRRWAVFTDLLGSPRLPSHIRLQDRADGPPPR